MSRKHSINTYFLYVLFIIFAVSIGGTFLFELPKISVSENQAGTSEEGLDQKIVANESTKNIPLMTADEPITDSPYREKLIFDGRKMVSVMVVQDEDERMRGLSGRESLPPDSGMLFIFPESDRYGFWMKDTKFPIDIIWINDAWLVVDVTKNATPASFPTIFKPTTPVRYVLEMPAGFSEGNDITVGSFIKYPVQTINN